RNKGASFEGKYNTWRPRPVVDFEPKHDESDELMDFIVDVICGGDEVVGDYVLQYIAHSIQRPEEKPTFALFLRSSQGCGKGFFGRLLNKLHGNNFADPKPKEVFGGHNTMMQNRIITFIDEFHTGGSKGTDEIKSLISEPFMWINKKFVDQYRVNNVSRYVMTTNRLGTVQFEAGERRYLYLLPSNKYEQDSQGYFKRLAKLLDDSDVIETFYAEMQNLDLEGFDPFKPIKTKGLMEEVGEHLPPVVDWLRLSVLDNSLIGFKCDSVTGMPCSARTKDIQDEIVKATGVRRKATSQDIKRELLNIGAKEVRHAKMNLRFGSEGMVDKTGRGYRFDGITIDMIEQYLNEKYKIEV
ncbi:primase-helicase family protein, partial [Vibrio sp. 10N.261.49.C12]|uniref:primase-helicase family protein n=1 Tax=Vibrio sp. 10N.261.49.C12 TaxID=3229671 RepID=UPI00354D7E9D